MHRDREKGMILWPLIVTVAAGVTATFLLLPAMSGEELAEKRRLCGEQARAAAEGAVALALARGAAVADVPIGVARAGARIVRDGDVVTVEAEAIVPFFRGSAVRAALTARYRALPDGTYRLAGWSAAP
jgi:hypothetical protein